MNVLKSVWEYIVNPPPTREDEFVNVYPEPEPPTKTELLLEDIASSLFHLSLKTPNVNTLTDVAVDNKVNVNVEAAETTALVDRFAVALVEATGKNALGFSPALLSKYGDDVYKVANALIVARNRNYQEIQEASWSRIGR
jgi:hypothetical protein